MTLTFNAETQRRIEARMISGRYASPDEVVEAALRLLEEREQARHEDIDSVRRKISIGLDQLDRGEGQDGERVFEELLAKLTDGE